LDADLDTLLIALYVELDDRIIPASHPRRTRRGPGRPPLVTDAELLCLAVAQVLRYNDEHHWLRAAPARVGHLFPRLLKHCEYNERCKKAANLLEAALRRPADATPGSAEPLRLMDATPIGCGQSKTTTLEPVRLRRLRLRISALTLVLGDQTAADNHPGRHGHRVQPGEPETGRRTRPDPTMNWQGRPLTSHEVIVQSIVATTTRAGLRVHAQLDTNTYETGVRISDRQVSVLPLRRHDWHPDWNYTLLPQPFEQVNTTPDPFDQPSPDLTWLRHPALTGLSEPDWEILLTALLTLHDQQRGTSLHQRRGHRPRQAAPGPASGLAADDLVRPGGAPLGVGLERTRPIVGTEHDRHPVAQQRADDGEAGVEPDLEEEIAGAVAEGRVAADEGSDQDRQQQGADGAQEPVGDQPVEGLFALSGAERPAREGETDQGEHDDRRPAFDAVVVLEREADDQAGHHVDREEPDRQRRDREPALLPHLSSPENLGRDRNARCLSRACLPVIFADDAARVAGGRLGVCCQLGRLTEVETAAGGIRLRIMRYA
jgi:DDE family transposase